MAQIDESVEQIESTEQTESTEQAEGAPPGESQEESQEGTSLPPEVAAREVTKARGEAARYRTELRAAQDKLASSKTIEEFQAATAELNTRIADLEGQLARERAIAKHKLPEELATQLDGIPAEKVEAIAQALAKIAPLSEDDGPRRLGGGLNPANEPGDVDVVELTRKARRRRR